MLYYPPAMEAFRKSPSPRRQALLLGFLLYAFGLLPFLAASHQHESDQGHGTCQLCLTSSQAYEAPSADTAIPVSVFFSFLPAQGSRPALQSLHLDRESRGPPTV